LSRAITAYHKLDLTGPRCERARRALPKRAKHLNSAQLGLLVERYGSGSTTYELADEFGVHRTTVSQSLKEAKIILRLHPPDDEEIGQMVRLYESRLSLATVGKQLGFSPSTVRRYINSQGIRTRDTHGRDKCV